MEDTGGREAGGEGPARGIMQRAAQGFYEMAVKYYPLEAGDTHADESGGIDK